MKNKKFDEIDKLIMNLDIKLPGDLEHKLMLVPALIRQPEQPFSLRRAGSILFFLITFMMLVLFNYEILSNTIVSMTDGILHLILSGTIIWVLTGGAMAIMIMAVFFIYQEFSEELMNFPV